MLSPLREPTDVASVVPLTVNVVAAVNVTMANMLVQTTVFAVKTPTV
jgi:phosphopantothenoylcysteine synthetase/decarboxylase